MPVAAIYPRLVPGSCSMPILMLSPSGMSTATSPSPTTGDLYWLI